MADYHRCALDSAGAVTCLGSELFGKTAVPAGVYEAISVSESSSCALDQLGAPVCWGCEEDGLDYVGGAGTDNGQCDAPVLELSALSASEVFTVGIEAGTGTLAYWSRSDQSELTGVTSGSLGSGIVALDSRGVGICAILRDGSADCWDANDTSADPEGAPGPYDQIRTNGLAACARYPDWTWDCWVPTGHESEVLDGERYVTADVGITSACGVRADDGTLACFGTIAAINPPEGAFTDVSVAETSACAVRDDGFVVCWGDLDRVEEVQLDDD